MPERHIAKSTVFERLNVFGPIHMECQRNPIPATDLLMKRFNLAEVFTQ